MFSRSQKEMYYKKKQCNFSHFLTLPLKSDQMKKKYYTDWGNLTRQTAFSFDHFLVGRAKNVKTVIVYLDYGEIS